MSSIIIHGIDTAEDSAGSIHHGDQEDSCSVCTSMEEVTRVLRDKMILRQSEIDIFIPHESFIADYGWFKKAFELHIDGSFNDAKYLERHFVSGSSSIGRANGLIKMHMNCNYRTTYDQEQILYSAVDQAIEEMGLNAPGVTNYDKILSVYMYIGKNTVYDQTFNRYSAYDAMIEKCAVCQGYATLFYLFMRKLGIPVEYISGISTQTNGRHGWNLVKLGVYWYNIDTTWEHIRKCGRITINERRYFMKNAEDFRDHIRDNYYTTKDFVDAHIMAKNSIV